MNRLPPLVLAAVVTLAGAALSLAIGVLVLGPDEATHLALPLAVAIVITLVAVAFASRRLEEASLRARFVSIAVFATLIGVANLGVLAWQMLVTDKDALFVATLLVYSTAAAIGAGLASAHTSATAVARLSEAANQLAAGDLDARAGNVGGGREVAGLAATFDEMAERLSESLRRERAAEAQRRDLVVAVSHDLRTPLADLRAMAEAIEDGVANDRDTVRAYSARMGESVTSLGSLIDDLFEFVQLDATAIETQVERARIDDVVRSALAACDGQALAKGLELRTDLGDLASAECSPRLTRVVQNLLQNAIRHTPADGTVVVAARASGSRIEIAVEDTGEGIEPAAVERIFEPFWRGDAARTSEGAGLGLALAKRIVEALGGSIAVESKPDRGSRFAVLLPEQRSAP